MIRFDTFYDLVKAQAAPEGIGENVVATFRTAVQNGLIAVQTDVPCYRDFHVDFVTKSFVRDFCNTDIFTGPRGTIVSVYAFKPGKDCTKYFYTQKSTSHIQCWIDQQRCTTALCAPSNSTAIYDSPYCNYPIGGTDGCLPPYLPAGTTEDDTAFISDCRERIFAVGPNYQVFLAPRFPCGYVVAIQWEGIKRTWADADPVFGDEDLKMAVAKFAEAQLAAKDRQWADVGGLKSDFIDLTRQMAQRCRRERRTAPPRDCSPQIDHILPFVNPTPDSVSLAVYPDGTPGADSAPLAPSPNLVALNTGHLLWVDAVYGNNGLALREREDRPFLTITAAKNAALSGDTIIVRPGSYNESKLLKSGVSYHFLQGAIISYLDQGPISTSTSNVLIGLGAKTFTVSPGLTLVAGDPVCISLAPNTTDPDFGGTDWYFNRMQGTVTSYAGTTLVVNITFQSGGGISYSNWLVFGPCYGVFDDNLPGVGSVSNISGSLQIDYRLTNPPNPLSQGPCVIANGTKLNWTMQRVSLAIPSVLGGTTTMAAFSIVTCGDNSFINIDQVTDTFEDWSNLDHTAPQIVTGGGGLGFYWQKGELHINCRRNTMANGYPLWCHEPPGGASTNIYYTGQLASSTLISGLYVDSAVSSSYRIWMNCAQIIAPSLALSLIGVARVYVTAQKILAIGTAGLAVSNSCELWLSTEKITAGGQWINHISSGGTSRNAYVTCQHFEDSSQVNSGILNSVGTGATLFIYGGLIKSGATGSVLVSHTGTGHTKLIGCTLDATANNIATNRPIVVSSDGLQIQNCVILAGSNADSSIFANAAKNVRMHTYSVATKAAHANITLNPNATYLIVDANAGL